MALLPHPQHSMLVLLSPDIVLSRITIFCFPDILLCKSPKQKGVEFSSYSDHCLHEILFFCFSDSTVTWFSPCSMACLLPIHWPICFVHSASGRVPPFARLHTPFPKHLCVMSSLGPMSQPLSPLILPLLQSLCQFSLICERHCQGLCVTGSSAFQ